MKRLETFAGIRRGTPHSLERDLRISPSFGPVPPATIDDSSRYGMIDSARASWSSPWYPCPWRFCSANVPNLYHHGAGQSLAGFLMRLMSGDAGREVVQINWPSGLSTACHWSLIVNELTHTLPLGGSSHPASPPGGAQAMLYATASPPSNDGGGGTDGPDDVVGEDGTFVILRISTSGGQPSSDDGARLER